MEIQTTSLEGCIGSVSLQNEIKKVFGEKGLKILKKSNLKFKINYAKGESFYVPEIFWKEDKRNPVLNGQSYYIYSISKFSGYFVERGIVDSERTGS